MFVLIKLPSVPNYFESSPGKAIRACAPKVLGEPGPQLVLVLVLVLVAAWLPRVTGKAKPSITQSLLGSLTSGLVLVLVLAHYLFIYNEEVWLQTKKLSWT